MKKLNDFIELISTVYNSVNLKYRVYIPFSISLFVMFSIIIEPDTRFWRQTIGYNLLGLSYFVSIYSIINLIEIKNLVLPRKKLIFISNLIFILFFFLVRFMFSYKTGILRIEGYFDYSGGLFPLLKLIVGYLTFIFLINRKDITQKLSS